MLRFFFRAGFEEKPFQIAYLLCRFKLLPRCDRWRGQGIEDECCSEHFELGDRRGEGETATCTPWIRAWKDASYGNRGGARAGGVDCLDLQLAARLAHDCAVVHPGDAQPGEAAFPHRSEAGAVPQPADAARLRHHVQATCKATEYPRSQKTAPPSPSIPKLRFLLMAMRHRVRRVEPARMPLTQCCRSLQIFASHFLDTISLLRTAADQVIARQLHACDQSQRTK